jgi:hypothetical protein
MAFGADPPGTSMGRLDKWMHSRRESLLVKRTRIMHARYDRSLKISQITNHMSSQVVHQ